jgi:hypothetical protein
MPVERSMGKLTSSGHDLEVDLCGSSVTSGYKAKERLTLDQRALSVRGDAIAAKDEDGRLRALVQDNTSLRLGHCGQTAQLAVSVDLLHLGHLVAKHLEPRPQRLELHAGFAQPMADHRLVHDGLAERLAASGVLVSRGEGHPSGSAHGNGDTEPATRMSLMSIKLTTTNLS